MNTPEQYAHNFQHELPTQVFHEIMQLPTAMAVACVLAILRSDEGKDQAIYNMESWLKKRHPELYAKLSTGKSDVNPDASEQAATVTVGEFQPEVHIDDIIQLSARTDDGASKLKQFGTWWKIVQASKPLPGSSVLSARPARWYIRSLSRKEQGLHNNGVKTVDVMWINKEHDPHFRIVNVCVFPKEFNYKDYQ